MVAPTVRVIAPPAVRTTSTRPFGPETRIVMASNVGVPPSSIRKSSTVRKVNCVMPTPVTARYELGSPRLSRTMKPVSSSSTSVLPTAFTFVPSARTRMLVPGASGLPRKSVTVRV